MAVTTSALSMTSEATSEITAEITGNRPKLRNGKPIPSSDDWRALERRALSFRLR